MEATDGADEQSEPKAPDGRTDKQALEAAATSAAALAAEGDDKPYTMTLRNGIVLKIKPVPQMMMRDAASRVPDPEVPNAWNAQRGESFPNPIDPGYIKAKEEQAIAQIMAGANACLLHGTEAVSVPSGYFMPDDDRWVEWVRYGGSEPDISSAPARYLSWLHYHAIRYPGDQSLLVMAPALLSSVSEEEVTRAVDAFRSSEKWRGNSLLPSEEQGADRDLLQAAAAGIGGGDGGARGSDILADAVARLDTPAPNRKARRSSPPKAPRGNRDELARRRGTGSRAKKAD